MTKSPVKQERTCDAREACQALGVGHGALEYLVSKNRIQVVDRDEPRYLQSEVEQLASEIESTLLSLQQVLTLMGVPADKREKTINALKKHGVARFNQEGGKLPNRLWNSDPDAAYFHEKDILRFHFNGLAELEPQEPKDLITNEEAAILLFNDASKIEQVHALSEGDEPKLKLYSGGRYSRGEVEKLKAGIEELKSDLKREHGDYVQEREVDVAGADAVIPITGDPEERGEEQKPHSSEDLITRKKAARLLGVQAHGELDSYTDHSLGDDRITLRVYNGSQFSRSAVLEVIRIREKEYISLDEAAVALGLLAEGQAATEEARDRLFEASGDGLLKLQSFPGMGHRALKSDVEALKKRGGFKPQSDTRSNPAPEPRETVTEFITDINEPAARAPSRNPVQEPAMSNNPPRSYNSVMIALTFIICSLIITIGSPFMSKLLDGLLVNNESFVHRPLVTPKRPPVPAQLAEESWFSESTTYSIMSVNVTDIPGKPGKQVRLFCHEEASNLWDCFEFIASPEDAGSFKKEEGKPFNFSDPWDADLKATKLKNGVRQFRHFVLGGVTGAPPVWKFESGGGK